MIPHHTQAQRASEQARRLADTFIGRLTQSGYTATVGAPVNYGHKVSLAHPSLPHTLHAVLYVGKDKTSFVKEGKNWPDGLYDVLLQEFHTLLLPHPMPLVAPLHRQQDRLLPTSMAPIASKTTTRTLAGLSKFGARANPSTARPAPSHTQTH